MGSIANAIIVVAYWVYQTREQIDRHQRTAARRKKQPRLLWKSRQSLVPVLVANLLGLAPDQAHALSLRSQVTYTDLLRLQGRQGYATARSHRRIVDRLLSQWVSTWLAVAGIWRYSSLAALTSIALTPAYAWFVTGHVEWTIATVVIAVFVFVKHKANIERLMSGTESRIGQKA